MIFHLLDTDTLDAIWGELVDETSAVLDAWVCEIDDLQLSQVITDPAWTDSFYGRIYETLNVRTDQLVSEALDRGLALF